MLASAFQMATPGLVHQVQPAITASIEYETLQRSYVAYAEVLKDPQMDAGKTSLGDLVAQMQARGVYGNNALALLQKYSLQINWQGMTPDVFNSFYRFVYFICREPNKRNVQVSTAVAAWQLVLPGRFRLLDRFCGFVSTHHKSSVILEDTWRQVLDFSRTVHEDLSNYDPASAWPVLLDEFVEHIKGARYANRPSVYVNINLQPLDMLSPWSVRPMTAVSPRSGSKRRPPDVHEVADQLQQLPLDSLVTYSGAGAGARMTLTAKRLRMVGSADTSSNRASQAGSPNNVVESAGSRAEEEAEQRVGTVTDSPMHSKRIAGAVGGAFAAAFGDMEVVQGHQPQRLEFTPGCRAPPAPHQGMQHHHSQQRSSLRVAGHIGIGLAGPGVRGNSQIVGPDGQQQPSCHQLQRVAGGTESQSRSSPTSSGSMDVLMDSEQWRQQQRAPFLLPGPHAGGTPGVMQATCHLPPCRSPGHGSRVDQGIARRNIERTQSVNAMMQVTVTETLGFN